MMEEKWYKTQLCKDFADLECATSWFGVPSSVIILLGTTVIYHNDTVGFHTYT